MSVYKSKCTDVLGSTFERIFKEEFAQLGQPAPRRRFQWLRDLKWWWRERRWPRFVLAFVLGVIAGEVLR